jgi:NTP pyrophosphatase (non-canonical NTP hydrolase)
MRPLPVNASISELQEYVAAWEEERGFADEGALQKCLLLGEEVGELFKAVRTHAGIKVDKASVLKPIGDELADTLMFVVAIANRFHIDLDAAFRSKDAKNRGREWS